MDTQPNAPVSDARFVSTITPQTPPHLASQLSPGIYPATKDAFSAYSNPQPNFRIELTRLKKKSMAIVWFLILVAFLGFVASLFLRSGFLAEGSAILFIFSLILGFFFTTGSVPSRGRIYTWDDSITTATTYCAILAFDSGLYLRRNGTEENFTFLPWPTITGVALEELEDKTSQILIATTADSVLLPSEFESHQIPVVLAGELLSAFGMDTPKKIQQGIQKALNTSRTTTTS